MTSDVAGPLSPSTWTWIDAARLSMAGRVRNSPKYGDCNLSLIAADLSDELLNVMIVSRYIGNVLLI